MPIYEYRCPSCGTQYERLLMNRDAPTPECPGCGSPDAERLVSRLGLAGTKPPTGDALFESDKLTFTQQQGLKGRVPQAAREAYGNMRRERAAAGKEWTHSHGPEGEELDPEDPRAVDTHYHPSDHVHVVDDEDDASTDSGEHTHDHAHAGDGDHSHDDHSHDDGHEH